MKSPGNADRVVVDHGDLDARRREHIGTNAAGTEAIPNNDEVVMGLLGIEQYDRRRGGGCRERHLGGNTQHTAWSFRAAAMRPPSPATTLAPTPAAPRPSQRVRGSRGWRRDEYDQWGHSQRQGNDISGIPSRVLSSVELMNPAPQPTPRSREFHWSERPWNRRGFGNANFGIDVAAKNRIRQSAGASRVRGT